MPVEPPPHATDDGERGGCANFIVPGIAESGINQEISPEEVGVGVVEQSVEKEGSTCCEHDQAVGGSEVDVNLPQGNGDEAGLALD